MEAITSPSRRGMKSLPTFRLLGVIKGPGSKWALSGFYSPSCSFPLVSRSQSQCGGPCDGKAGHGINQL